MAETRAPLRIFNAFSSLHPDYQVNARSFRARGVIPCLIKIKVVRANQGLAEVICGLFFLINAGTLPPPQKSDKKRYGE
ncbi:hypothetical protein CEXT_353511 [Caerostris extrusa]|uniref:Uncharacterized protein n=1 Tax=Caerostris extrusa TaxID=172846 RepID=A0AAV4QQ98_CAEEX|nr:hypothetical protein CEXT_353511 [Caerostris extrusa]